VVNRHYTDANDIRNSAMSLPLTTVTWYIP